MASVIFVIAPEKFRDEELFDTREVLESFGIETKIASTIKGKCTGTLGGIANSDYSLNEIDSKDFDAICFIGGGGTPIIRADKAALSLAKEFYKNGKLVCAICWATTILAKAGILDGKKGDSMAWG